MISRILVCLDASARAAGVLGAATEIANTFDARMILYRAVVVPPEFPAAAHTAAGDPLPDAIQRAALDELRVLAKDNTRASIEPPIVTQGQPWRAILETADRLDVDMIVLGSHGYHGWDRLLGTTCAKVANHARCNVLIVHEKASS